MKMEDGAQIKIEFPIFHNFQHFSAFFTSFFLSQKQIYELIAFYKKNMQTDLNLHNLLTNKEFVKNCGLEAFSLSYIYSGY